MPGQIPAPGQEFGIFEEYADGCVVGILLKPLFSKNVKSDLPDFPLPAIIWLEGYLTSVKEVWHVWPTYGARPARYTTDL